MTSSKKNSGDINQTELVENLADIAKRLDLSEIEYQLGDLKIRVARQMAAATMSVALPEAPRAAVAPPPAAAAESMDTMRRVAREVLSQVGVPCCSGACPSGQALSG